MNSTFFIITAPLMLFVLCVIIAVWIDMRFKEREYQAEYKLTHIGDLSYLKNHNTDKFIEEAEFILEYLKNKRYSEFHKFRYVESKHHNSCYYLVGYTSRTNTKKSKDKKIFKRVASNVKKINIKPKQMRGGIRL